MDNLQLKENLKKTEFIFNTKVGEVKDKEIICDNGEIIKTHLTIIAANPNPLIANLKSQELKWKSCCCLYFEAKSSHINGAVIGLVADTHALINNLFYHTSIETKSRGDKELISVTVVKDHSFTEEQLVEKVTYELYKYCGIKDVEFIKLYTIRGALPDITNLVYDLEPNSTRLKPTVFLAGDYLLNGSLNAAMMSGKRAAQGIITTLEDGLIVEDLTSEYIN